MGVSYRGPVRAMVLVMGTRDEMWIARLRGGLATVQLDQDVHDVTSASSQRPVYVRGLEYADVTAERLVVDRSDDFDVREQMALAVLSGGREGEAAARALADCLVEEVTLPPGVRTRRQLVADLAAADARAEALERELAELGVIRE